MSRDLKTLGKVTPRIDALERVTGQAHYAEDISLPGMLYARVLRSPLPHARVRGIDVSAAEALPGVRAVLHAKNTDTIWSSGDQHDRRRVFAETVRFVGESVAAVAAIDRHTAEEALGLIRVDYEDLPAVFTVEDALRQGAPQIHPEGNADKQALRFEAGDIEAGIRQADAVYEADFTSQHHNNAQLERRVSLALWDGGRLTVYASTQGIYNCRADIAHDLKIPLSKVRVICQYMGGGFGNKNQGYDFDLIAALLARQTRRPVRVEFTRHEDFMAVHGRWATRQHYRIGYKKDGTLTAIDLKATSNMGAYLRSSGGIDGPRNYVSPNIRSEVTRVHTNATPSANYRGPAGPQGVFAIESAMDDIAARLGMDPVEFRLRNAVRDIWSNKTPISSNGLPDCIRRGAEVFGWAEKRREYAQQTGPLRRGAGMAIGTWGASLGPSSAEVKLLPDGSVKVSVGVTDIGTGAKTVMALIAAEALGVPLESISVIWGDTDVAPFSPGESGSRTTGHTGTAVIEACQKVREELLAQAAAGLKVRREDLDLRDGKIVLASNPNQSWRIPEVTARNIDAITAAVTTPQPDEGGKVRLSFAAHFAEVEANLETGKVRVLRYVAAHDSGTIINPLTATSQVKGGVIQGIGMALREELIWDHNTGVPVTNYYHGAKPLIHPEAPEVEVVFVDPDDPYGPYGAKTLGEIPIVPVVGAVANAIFHATGARIRELPITPDKLLNAFRQTEKKRETA
jgi:xanthine dehydrogenase molybdenum-binding subunit